MSVQRYNHLIELHAFEQLIDSLGAVEIMRLAAPGVKVIRTDNVYYPYLQIVAKVSERILFRDVSNKVNCLVDLVSGSEALADVNAATFNIMVPSKQIISPQMSKQEALQKGKAYLNFIVSYRKKVLTIPMVTVESVALVYKAYWVVQCIWKQQSTFSVLVDSVSGQYQAIPM